MMKIFSYFRLKKVRVSITIAVLFLMACSVRGMPNRQKESYHEQTKQTQSEQNQIPLTEHEEPPQFNSDTAPEDCLLCNGGKETLLAWYFGQENIGFISLNTFRMSCVEINRYDDRKKLIEKPLKGSSSTVMKTGDGGFLSFVSESPNRGYAHATITFNQDEVLDIKKAGEFLCMDCLNCIMSECRVNQSYGVGVIDFKTKDIRLLEPDVTAFILNDFYISCDLRDNRKEGSSAEMDFLIFYCPERYGK